MGNVFNSGEDLCEICAELFKRISNDLTLSTKILEINKIIHFHFSSPRAEVTVDATQKPLQVVFGADAKPGDIRMWMSGDAAHQLWMGKITPMSAIMSRQIRATGPIQSMRDISTIFTMATQIYRNILVEKGHGGLAK